MENYHIENSSILKNYCILDFSHRLPGPLAGHILHKMGARVIKIEDKTFKDPFIHGLFVDFDSSFAHWYEEINEGKEVVRLNFKDPNIKEQIATYLDQAQGMIQGLPPKLQAQLGIQSEDLKKRPLAVVEMGATRNGKSNMHDLNAFGEAGLLELFVEGHREEIVAPPFLPIAGATLSSRVASDLLGLMLKSARDGSFQHTTSYLLDSLKDLYDPLWPQADRQSGRKKFLHNGAYPCYALYRLADGHYLAMAAVEEKFWERVREIFDIPLKGEERFRTDEEAFKIVASKLGQKSSEDVEQIEEDICLNLVRTHK